MPLRSSPARGRAAPPIPVVGGVVEARDTPIYLDGIGTVQAFNTVTVHAQVDGVLQKVAFREGQDVRAGDLLAIVDPRPYQAQLDQATAKKAEDEAQASGATTAYRRNFSLLQQGLMDHQTVDTEKATMDQFKATVQADEAAIEQQAVELGYTRITAPIAGRVGLRLVDEGNVVRSTDAGGLVVITQLKPISVVFTLPQQNWPQIQQRVAAGQHLAVLADGRGGRADRRGDPGVVDNQIDATTGTIKLKAAFPNEKLALWPGQFVNVRLLMQTRRGGLVVPASVIQRGPQGSYAFVIGADSRVSPRLVAVAQIDGGYALIDRGLAAGERVVVDGQSKLQAGNPVSDGSGAVAPGTAAMNISAIFIRRPIATSLLMAGIVLLGSARVISAADLGAAEGRLPDDPGHDAAARRLAGGHDLLGHDAPRAAVRPDQRADFDEFDQLVRRQHDHAAVRARARDRQRRAGRAGGDQRRDRRPAAEPPNPPIYNKVNPADTAILTLAITSDTLPDRPGERPGRRCWPRS